MYITDNVGEIIGEEDCRECAHWETCPCGKVSYDEDSTTYRFGSAGCMEFDRKDGEHE